MNRNKNWKRWWLTYFDWNRDGKTNWWEYLIPFSILLGIEILAEIVARIIIK